MYLIRFCLIINILCPLSRYALLFYTYYNLYEIIQIPFLLHKIKLSMVFHFFTGGGEIDCKEIQEK